MDEQEFVEIENEVIDTDPLLLGRALYENASFNEADNSVPVVCTTENPCLTLDADGEWFYEILSHDPAHVRLDRFRSCGPFLDNHDKKGSVTKVQLGSVEDPYIANRELRARVVFSDRPEIAGYVNDVKKGTAKGVSTGYRVFRYRNVGQPEDRYRSLLAIDWEPVELSGAPVPVDYKSGFRVRSLDKSPDAEVEVEQSENIENNLITDKTRSIKMEETPEEKLAREALEATARKQERITERNRSLEIIKVVNLAGIEPAFAEEHIEAETTIDQVRALVIEKMATKQKDLLNGNSGAAPRASTGNDAEITTHLKGIEEALSIRAFGEASIKPETEYGKKAVIRKFSLSEHARSLVTLQGHNTELIGNMEILERALTSTQYPIALANVLNKNLRKRYQVLEPQWKKFATQESFDDFKERKSVMVDGDFTPDEITEQGEYQFARFLEAGDGYGLKTYGKKIALSRKMMYNDDLSAFTKFAPFFANGMVELQTKIVYGLFTQNGGAGRLLGEDNKTLFHVDHNNLAATGSAISAAVNGSLDKAVVAMTTHKSLAGSRIQITPKYLVVSPFLKTTAQQILNATIVATKTSDTNTFRGAFELIVDPYLSDDPYAWYIIADPATIEVIKYAVLAGEEGIFTAQKYDWETDELVVKVRHDFNATIEDPRGVYKNPGIAPS